MAGDQERQHGAGADPEVVIQKSAPGAEDQHPGQAADPAGQDRDHHLYRLQQQKQQRPPEPRSPDEGGHGLPGSQQSAVPGQNGQNGTEDQAEQGDISQDSACTRLSPRHLRLFRRRPSDGRATPLCLLHFHKMAIPLSAGLIRVFLCSV